jgi:hypothetical protein
LETISLDKGLSSRDYESDAELMRAEEAMKSCKTCLCVVIGYGLGGMQVAIEGVDSGSCAMAIMYDIEMGTKSLDCSVPLDKMADWTSWKNTDLPGVSERSLNTAKKSAPDGDAKND